jgi:hypothetical protein
MPVIFRYFAFIGAAIGLISWGMATRRAEASGAPAAKIARAREIIRAFFGGGALWFLLLGTLQLVGGASTPLFFIEWPAQRWNVVAAWVSIYLLWGLLLRGLWTTDAVEVLTELHLIQNPLGLEARPLRRFYTGLIVLGAIVAPLVAFMLRGLP